MAHGGIPVQTNWAVTSLPIDEIELLFALLLHAMRTECCSRGRPPSVSVSRILYLQGAVWSVVVELTILETPWPSKG